MALRLVSFDVQFSIQPADPAYFSRANTMEIAGMSILGIELYLQRLGFETIIPGKMTLAQQTELFRAAEISIGTGTGITKMLFGPQGTKILQPQEPSLPVHALWTMSEAQGHKYWYLDGETIPNPPHSIANILADLAKLEQGVEVVLNTKSQP